MSFLNGGNIVNVERVEIITNETTARTFVFKTSTSATFTPNVSAGVEKEQRIKNTLMGLIRTEDLVKGYDIDLNDQRLIMDVFALIDGGAVTNGSGSGEAAWTQYSAPQAGSETQRVGFTLDLYTSDRGADGEAVEYYKWSFPNCKGKPVTVGSADDDFYTIGYTIQSRPSAGTPVMTLKRCGAMPPVFSAQPEDAGAAVGETVTFSVSVAGTGALTYQWQSKTASATEYTNTSSQGYNTATLTVEAQTTRNGASYRCVVSDTHGNTVTSAAATLTVTE